MKLFEYVTLNLWETVILKTMIIWLIHNEDKLYLQPWSVVLLYWTKNLDLDRVS